MKVERKYGVVITLIIAVFMMVFLQHKMIAASSVPLRFQGRFVGLLCEKLPDGRYEVHDQIIDNGLSVDFSVNDDSAPTQLTSNHKWAGKSKIGILSDVRLGQAGQLNIRLGEGSLRFQGLLNLIVDGKQFSLPYVVSTETLSLPAGLPAGIGVRKLQITEPKKSSNLAVAGITNLEGPLAAAFRDLLQRAGLKVGNGQLLFVTSLDGKVSRIE